MTKKAMFILHWSRKRIAYETLYTFCCSFCVPTADEKLAGLIRVWNNNDTLPKKRIEVSVIVDRVKEIGGINLLWY